MPTVTTVYRRQVKEGRINQGEDERIPYDIDMAPWVGAGAITIVATEAKEVTNNYVDVSGTVLSGASTVAGQLITSAIVQNTLRDKVYRIEIRFTSGGATYGVWWEIAGER